MSEEDNERMIRRFYEEAVANGQVDILDDLVAEDAIEHETMPGREEPAQGRDGVKEVVRGFNEAFPDLDVEVEDVVTDGDRVAARTTWRGTHEGSLFGLEPTNETVEVTRLDMLRVEEGRFQEHWGLADNLSMMRQMGQQPP